MAGACKRFANLNIKRQSLESEINVNVSSSKLLEVMFNILLKKTNKLQGTYSIKINHGLLVELCFFI